jgi:hypothetical protein
MVDLPPNLDLLRNAESRRSEHLHARFGKSGAPQSSNKIALTIEEEPEKSVIEQSVSTSDCLSEPDLAPRCKSSKNTEHEN